MPGMGNLHREDPQGTSLLLTYVVEECIHTEISFKANKRWDFLWWLPNLRRLAEC